MSTHECAAPHETLLRPTDREARRYVLIRQETARGGAAQAGVNEHKVRPVSFAFHDVPQFSARRTGYQCRIPPDRLARALCAQPAGRTARPRSARLLDVVRPHLIVTDPPYG